MTKELPRGTVVVRKVSDEELKARHLERLNDAQVVEQVKAQPSKVDKDGTDKPASSGTANKRRKKGTSDGDNKAK